MQSSWQQQQSEILALSPVGSRYLIIKLRGPEAFSHRPGQYTKLSFFDQQGLFERYYSIASAPSGNREFELCLILDDQRLREILSTLRVGDSIVTALPQGRFPWPEPERDLIALAGGSGITPLRAILEARLQSAAPGKSLLLYGCQRDDEIPFYQDFLNWAQQYPSFRAQFFADHTPLHRAQPGNPLEALRNLSSLTGQVFALCGPPALMKATQSLLLERGIAAQDILQDAM